jgi:hypothetical protein
MIWPITPMGCRNVYANFADVVLIVCPKVLSAHPDCRLSVRGNGNRDHTHIVTNRPYGFWKIFAERDTVRFA